MTSTTPHATTCNSNCMLVSLILLIIAIFILHFGHSSPYIGVTAPVGLISLLTVIHSRCLHTGTSSCCLPTGTSSRCLPTGTSSCSTQKQRSEEETECHHPCATSPFTSPSTPSSSSLSLASRYLPVVLLYLSVAVPCIPVSLLRTYTGGGRGGITLPSTWSSTGNGRRTYAGFLSPPSPPAPARTHLHVMH